MTERRSDGAAVSAIVPVGVAAWARDWGSALTMIACAGAATLALLAALPGVPDPVGGLGSRWVGWMVHLAIALLAWRASHHPALAKGARHAWWRVGTAFLLAGAADIAWRLLGQPSVSWVDIPRLAFYPLMLWALLGLPTARSGERERLQFALDAGAVVVCGAMVLWYFILEPTLESVRAGVAMPARVLVRAAYPLGDLLLLIGALAVVLRRPAAGSRAALRFLTAGIGLYLVADVVFAYGTVGGRYRPGELVELAWIAGSCLVMAGAHLQWMRGGAADAVPHGGDEVRGFSLVPYTAFALAYALLLLAARSLWAEPIGGLVIGAVGLTALVVMRQLAAMRENARLLREQAARESEARFEARFRSLVQSSSDVILILSPDATIQYVSAAAERVFGYEPHSLMGRRLAELVHPDDAAGALAGFAEAVRARGEMHAIYCRVRRADGTWRHVESIGTNYLDDPSIRGVVLNARDVSERAALEAELTHQAFHDPLTG
ncbi:MAG TPA: PAS domain S-box protein, partial [Gemmatimonadaceae bacterium]|nr:PAS domain S-box protein [Gemmatimonadaceae bacterium]